MPRSPLSCNEHTVSTNKSETHTLSLNLWQIKNKLTKIVRQRQKTTYYFC